MPQATSCTCFFCFRIVFGNNTKTRRAAHVTFHENDLWLVIRERPRDQERERERETERERNEST